MGILLQVLVPMFVTCLLADENSLPPTTATESEFLSSRHWEDKELKVFIFKDDVIPSGYFEALTAHIPPIHIAKVVCPGHSDDGEICSLLSHHDVVVKRGGGGGGGEDVIGVDFQYRNKMEFVSDALEMMVGRNLTHIASYSSLVSFMEAHPNSLIVLSTNRSSSEYISMLRTYLALQPLVAPLGVTSSAASLPLAQRPQYMNNEPSLHVWFLKESGKKWYMCRNTKSMNDFIVRSQYPVMLNHTDDIDSYKKKGVNLVVFFPGLPGVSDLPFHQLVDRVATYIYFSYIVVVADRERDRKLAKRFFITNDKTRPQVVVLPNGVEKYLVSFDIQSDNLDMEVYYMADILTKTAQDLLRDRASLYNGRDDTLEAGRERDLPMITVMDVHGLEIFLKRTKLDIIVSFCKKKDGRCEDDSYFALDRVKKITSRDESIKPFHFLTVRCNSVDDILKFKMNIIPTFGLYNHSEKVWLKGMGDLYNYRDILTLIVKATGRRELFEISLDSPEDTEIFQEPPPSQKEDDIYGVLARTMPRPVLPTELVLTRDNFEMKIQQFDKTAVLFYLHWSVETKIILHHFLAAWEQLDKGKNVTFGTLGCETYTTVCSHYGVTSFPTVLTFTPSTLDTPSPLPPSIGVLDSVHLLQVLMEQEDEKEPMLVEVTPASLPLLLRESLTTPLVLWCHDDPLSELGLTFGEIAFSEVYLQTFSFAWLNSSKHNDVLATVEQSSPSVVALQFDKFSMYQMELVSQLQAETFREQLVAFLDGLMQGSIAPIRHLLHKDWLPSQPRIPFPSRKDKNDMVPEEAPLDDYYSDEDYDDGAGKEYDDTILDSIPMTKPPEVKDYPVYEDQSHEEESYGRDEL